MKIVDEVYGDHEVSDRLLIDLLSSQAVTRLRNVSQAGASSLVRSGRSVSRFEHSIGVMLLTRTLGGSTLEQAAGLLQDVSHTAFSHTIDYVFNNRKEEFHESILAAVVHESDLPSILNNHSLTWEQIFTPENLKIVDAPAPALCTDRIDYTLRDLVRFGHISGSDAVEFVASLCVRDGSIVCMRENLAERFVEWYSYLVEHLFMNPLELYAHEEFAKIIRDAMESGTLSEKDLHAIDSLILEKLKANERSRERLSELLSVKEVVASNGKGARRVYSKGRIIDPPILLGGKVVPFSQAKPEIASIWTNIINISVEGLMVRRVR